MEHNRAPKYRKGQSSLQDDNSLFCKHRSHVDPAPGHPIIFKNYHNKRINHFNKHYRMHWGKINMVNVSAKRAIAVKFPTYAPNHPPLTPPPPPPPPPSLHSYLMRAQFPVKSGHKKFLPSATIKTPTEFKVL